MSEWVQHISGKGAKYKVTFANDSEWCVWQNPEGLSATEKYCLPKSEYRLCESPEAKWVDVSEYFNAHDLTFASHILSGYRIRKVQLRELDSHEKFGHQRTWAFIVESTKP